MSRKRLDTESVRSVEIEILLEAVRIEKVIAHPTRRKSRQLARIEIEFDAFSGAEDDEAIIRGGEQIQHIAKARVVAGGTGVRAGHAAIRERINGVARGSEPNFTWVT